MSDQQQDAKQYPVKQSATFAGSAALTMALVDVLAHMGPTGLLLSGLAGYVAWRHGPEVYDHIEQQLKGIIPPRQDEDQDQNDQEPEHQTEPGASNKRSFWDRALGRYPTDQIESDSDQAARPGQPEPDQEDSEPGPEPYNQVLHRGCLYLGRYLYPDPREVLSKRIGMFGIPGSGKSNGVAVFVEELGKLPILINGEWVPVGVPFILADTEGEYFDLCSRRYLMRPFYASSEKITPENAYQFGQAVLEKGLQVVLDLQTYKNDDQAAEVMIGIIAGMRAWAEARNNDERASCMFILDEAAIWLPQRQEESTLSKEKNDDGLTLLARLQQAFFGTVVRRGRKRGIGFLFATQRPADLDKRCISCDWLMLFRQTFPNDLNKYAELGVPKDAAQALAPGEAVVIDPRGELDVYQFRKRHSPDNAKSLGPASLQRHAARWAAATGEPASQRPAERRELPEQIGIPAPALAPARPVMEDLQPANPNQRRLTALHRQTLENYRPGVGLRGLGELIGVGKDKAGDLKKDLIKWGFIEDDEAAE